ncbi:MAG: T9SS type A sorting domain-containing protein [bacterium]
MRNFSLVVAGLVMFTKLSYAGWTIGTIDSVGDVGKYTSLCFWMGGVAASYYDETNGNLKCRLDLLDKTSQSFDSEDSAGNVGKFTSIGGCGDTLFISYYDETNGNLKIARTECWKDGFFQTYAIDSVGNVGLFTSLYIDKTHDVPYISYYDETNGDLKLACLKDSVWTVQKVDTAGDVGRYNSIAGHSDTIYISYYDSTNGDLKLAKYNGTNWQIEKVDTMGDVGKYSSVSYFYSDVYIYYYDETSGDLKSAHYNNISWSIGIIDSTGDVGMFCNGKGFLTYYDKTNGNFLSLGVSSWLVDTAGDVGGYSSSVAETELFFAIYYDFTNKDLKCAYVRGAVEEQATALNNTFLTVTPNLSTKNFSISYTLPSTSSVNLKVFNVSGKVVDVLSNEKQNAGKHQLFWQPNNLPNGLYFLQLNANETKLTKKLILMK